jgi:hypothetical protein
MLTYKMGGPRLLKPKESGKEGESVKLSYESDFDEFLTSTIRLESSANTVTEEIFFDYPGIGIVTDGSGKAVFMQGNTEKTQNMKAGDVFYIIPSEKITLVTSGHIQIYFCSCK